MQAQDVKDWVAKNGAVDDAVWEKRDDGYLHRVRQLSRREVWDHVARFLRDNELDAEDVEHVVMNTWQNVGDDMPKRYTWCVTAYPGSNEGYWVSVGLVAQSDALGETKPQRAVARFVELGSLKLWNWDRALEISTALTRLVHEV